MHNHSWTRILPNSLVINLATLGPLGYLKAPGTWGSLAGAGWFIITFFYMQPVAVLLLTMLSAYIAIAICGEAEIRMQKRDPSEIILDEFIAMPLCFTGLPVSEFAQPWIIILAGFILFRIFDIIKPFGINRLQNLPNGSGVVMDDIAAALASCVALHIGIAIVDLPMLPQY